MTDERDDRLGSALRDLPVPDHGPGFWDRLEDRLAEEAPEPVDLRGRRWMPGLALLAAAACVALALAVVANRTGDEDSRVTTRPTTPEPGGRAPAGLAGRLVARAAGQPDREMEFTVARDGSFLARFADGAASAYDAGVGRMVTLFPGPAGESFAEIRTGLAPADPDPSGYGSNPLSVRLGAYVVGQAAAGNPEVDETLFLGRASWSLSTPVAPNELGESGDHLDVVVDRETGLVLKRVETRAGRVLREEEVTEVAVLDDLRGVAFDLAVPAGAQVREFDEGYRPVPPAPGSDDRMAFLTDLAVPDGYRPVRAWRLDGAGQPTGAEGGNPPSTDVLIVEYADGFHRIVVSLRTMVDGPDRWYDPFSGEGQPLEAAPITVRADGAFPGAAGELVVDAAAVPHLWLRIGGEEGTEGLIATAAGPLDAPALRRLAQSIRPA